METLPPQVPRVQGEMTGHLRLGKEIQELQDVLTTPMKTSTQSDNINPSTQNSSLIIPLSNQPFNLTGLGLPFSISLTRPPSPSPSPKLSITSNPSLTASASTFPLSPPFTTPPNIHQPTNRIRPQSLLNLSREQSFSESPENLIPIPTTHATHPSSVPSKCKLSNLSSSLTTSPLATTPRISAETARSRKLHGHAKAPVKVFSKQGKALNTSQQTAILNVHKYFCREWVNQGPLQSLGAIKKRTADALGVTPNTVGIVVRKSECGESITTPGKKRPYMKRRVLGEVDDFMKSNIRRVIYNMYSKGQKVTMDEVLKQCQAEDVGFKGQVRSLATVVLTLGFKWKKTDNRRVLIESPKIALQRIHFLRSYIQNIESVNPLQPIFLDETWIFQRGTIGKTWQDDSTKSSKRGDLNDGRRFIVVHAGGRGGFVPNSSLLFASGNNTGDYHGEMNSDNFERWLENMLGNLEEPSLIVMDNASYHSAQVNRQPTTSWKKEEIIKWLQNEKITFSPQSLKPELLDIARRNKRNPVHRCDTLIRDMGHDVLRLPPYHCQFNPIELIWATTKKMYNDNIGVNGEYTIENTKRIWQQALDSVTPDDWAKRVDHCERLIRDTWEQEMGRDTTGVEPLIINLQDSDEDTSSDSDEENDDDELLATPL